MVECLVPVTLSRRASLQGCVKGAPTVTTHIFSLNISIENMLTNMVAHFFPQTNFLADDIKAIALFSYLEKIIGKLF